MTYDGWDGVQRVNSIVVVWHVDISISEVIPEERPRWDVIRITVLLALARQLTLTLTLLLIEDLQAQVFRLSVH